jgi:hypothetical protein
MRHAVALAVALFWVVPILAQEPPLPAYQVLRATLALDEGQIHALQELMTNRQTAATEAVVAMSSLESRLQQALGVAEPDLPAIGAIIISMRAVERSLSEKQQSLRETFFSKLSAEQLQRIESMRAARAALRGAEALEQLGL